MPDLTTTIGELKKYNPCKESYKKYISTIGGYDKNTKISLSNVLKICGIKDAIWFLRCFEYKEYAIVCAEIAESVLPIYEKYYPKDNRPRKAIEEIKLYFYGYSSEEQLKNAAAAAAAASAASAAASAAADDDAYYAAAAASAAASAAADDDAYYAADAKKEQWKDTEKILIQFIKRS